MKMADDGSASDNQDHDAGQHHQPRNLQGILHFCIEQTKAEDAPAPSTFREISPERKEWLSKALDEMVGDPIKEVKEYIKRIGKYLVSENPTDEMRESALDSLEELFDWCESYDIANDFHKIGGFSILNELMTHSESKFREYSFRLIGVLVQNNAVCQKAMLDDDFLPVMLSVLNSEQDPSVQIQAVQAISCLVRDSIMTVAHQQFAVNNGFGVLKKVLQTPGPFKRVVKVAFFLSAMCEQHPEYKDIVCELGIVELLVQEIKGEHQHTHEQVMEALLCLAREHPPTQRILGKVELDVKTLLQQRCELLKDKEEYQDEMRHAQELLRLIDSQPN